LANPGAGGLLRFLGTDASAPENLQSEVQEWGFHSGEYADNGYFPDQSYLR
jgi:hypothetical protein